MASNRLLTRLEPNRALLERQLLLARRPFTAVQAVDPAGGLRRSPLLRAYGPATKQDVGQWAGIQRLSPIGESLERLPLRAFEDESGRVLYDLPRARGVRGVTGAQSSA